MSLSKCSILWCLVFLAIGFVSFSGCKPLLQRKQSNASPTSTNPKSPDLNGLWVMGNATSGTEASTIVRIEQNGQNIIGLLEQPSKDYAEQYGVKKGDLEFEGVLEGRTVRGQVHSYHALVLKEDCPKLSSSVVLKNFELSLAGDENSLDGWTVNNRVSVKCQEYTKGQSPYTFRRLNNQNTQ